MRQRVRAHTLETLITSFRDQIDSGDACWLWMGYIKSGYGSISYQGKMLYTHHLAWKIANGAIPKGMHVLHTCDVKRCVNPDHLYLGTNGDNMRDKEARGLGNHGKGESRPNAKLTEQDVRKIRELRLSGLKSRELEALYPLTGAQLLRVARGDAWKHVDAPVAPRVRELRGEAKTPQKLTPPMYVKE